MSSSRTACSHSSCSQPAPRFSVLTVPSHPAAFIAATGALSLTCPVKGLQFDCTCRCDGSFAMSRRVRARPLRNHLLAWPLPMLDAPVVKPQVYAPLALLLVAERECAW